MLEVAAQEAGDEAPDKWQAGDPEDQSRRALQRVLRLPRGGERPAQLPLERRLVVVEPVCERTCHREPGADEGLVHPVPRERVDEAGRVPGEQHPSAAGAVSRTAHRQPEAAHRLEPLRGNAVLRAGTLEVLAEARPFRLPAADADVDVVALRKDPRVAARDGAELDDRPAAVVLARVNMVDVALEGHAVRAVSLQPERAD